MGIAAHSERGGINEINVALDDGSESGVRFPLNVIAQELLVGLVVHSLKSTHPWRNPTEIVTSGKDARRYNRAETTPRPAHQVEGEAPSACADSRVIFGMPRQAKLNPGFAVTTFEPVSLNPAVEFYAEKRNHRWTLMNTDFSGKSPSPSG